MQPWKKPKRAGGMAAWWQWRTAGPDANSGRWRLGSRWPNLGPPRFDLSSATGQHRALPQPRLRAAAVGPPRPLVILLEEDEGHHRPRARIRGPRRRAPPPRPIEPQSAHGGDGWRIRPHLSTLGARIHLPLLLRRGGA
jgi:hypothetical protein